MAKEILKDEILNDEQLDGIAGGSYSQTFENMNEFSRRTGYHFHGSDSDRRDQLRNILFRCGIKLKDHGGSDPNEFFILDKHGNRVGSISERAALDLAVQNYRDGRFIC